MIVSPDGLPLRVLVTPANVPDHKAVKPLLDSLPPVPGPRGRPKTKPDKLLADRAYGVESVYVLLITLGILAVIPRRNSQTHGSGLGRIRYVVERTFAWLGHWRRLRVCYEKCQEHFQAYHDLAASVICFRRLQAGGTRF